MHGWRRLWSRGCCSAGVLGLLTHLGSAGWDRLSGVGAGALCLCQPPPFNALGTEGWQKGPLGSPTMTHSRDSCCSEEGAGLVPQSPPAWGVFARGCSGLRHPAQCWGLPRVSGVLYGAPRDGSLSTKVLCLGDFCSRCSPVLCPAEGTLQPAQTPAAGTSNAAQGAAAIVLPCKSPGIADVSQAGKSPPPVPQAPFLHFPLAWRAMWEGAESSWSGRALYPKDFLQQAVGTGTLPCLP